MNRAHELKVLTKLWRSGKLVHMGVRLIGSRQVVVVQATLHEPGGVIVAPEVKEGGRYWNIDSLHLVRPLTPGVEKGLRIVSKSGSQGIRPRYFAKQMWPDSPGWNKVYGCGHGSHRGSGMYKTGGSFLAKLRKLGLIYPKSYEDQSYRITSEGLYMLKACDAFDRLEIK